MAHIDAMARWLRDQHRRRLAYQAIPNIPDLAAAYDVQDRHVELLRARGDGIAGYKIGLTSPRMQALCGIAQPVAGAVLGSRVHRSGATLPARGFVHPGVESELAVRLGRDVDGPPSIEDVRRSVAEVAAAFEIVDDRHADYARLDARTLVADNAWNAGIVLGPAVAGPAVHDMPGRLHVDGRLIDQGRSSDALGDPLAAVAWLAAHLASRGKGLRAGHWVMTGSIVPTRFARAGEHYTFTLGDLPAVELTFFLGSQGALDAARHAPETRAAPPLRIIEEAT